MTTPLTRQAADWTGAACIGEDPDAFFPEHGGPQTRIKTLCGGCPVIRECLSFATAHEEIGIWAGTNERDRRIIRRRYKPDTDMDILDAAPHGTIPALRAHRDRGETPCDKCAHATRARSYADQAAHDQASLALPLAFAERLEAAMHQQEEVTQ